jgi:hypothetical protein
MAGFLKRLFGSGGADAPKAAPGPSEVYQGFAITPDPAEAEGGWRIGATIEKDGRTHVLIRADTLRDRGAAIEASVAKARQVIDQQGDGIFG